MSIQEEQKKQVILINSIDGKGETVFPNPHPEAQWFKNADKGLFIHWGISSAHGGIELSWGMFSNLPWDKEGKHSLKPIDYFELAKKFKPTDYNPKKWLEAAKDAGFTYAVLTTKHHDGFALWPSKYGNFNTATYWNGTDLVKGFVEACKEVGLKCGLYFSPPDWHYNKDRMSFRYGSDGSVDNPHYNKNFETCNFESNDQEWNESLRGLMATNEELMEFKEYTRCQIEELLTNYGKIDVIWFDGGPECFSIEWLRELQPHILTNTRMHGYGDFSTPEGVIPDKPLDGLWEVCDIWGTGGWGYMEPGDYFSAQVVYERYVKTHSMGGIYLINVSPKPDGTLPPLYYQRMNEFANLILINQNKV